MTLMAPLPNTPTATLKVVIIIIIIINYVLMLLLIGKPVIIGSYSNWWRFHSGCQFNNAWNSWICPRQQETQEILNIGIIIITHFFNFLLMQG